MLFADFHSIIDVRYEDDRLYGRHSYRAKGQSPEDGAGVVGKNEHQ